MRIVEHDAELLAYTQLPRGRAEAVEGMLHMVTNGPDPCSDMARVVERCGRVSWKSEDKIGPGTAEGFCVRVVNIKKDYSIAEHASATVLFTADRYATHQLVRHRLGAMTQESTHYINYGKEKFGSEIAVCRPLGIPKDSREYGIWLNSCLQAEKNYLDLLARGVKHYHARFALPGCLKSEIAMTYNLRMWRTILDQRTTPNNTPEIAHLCWKAARILGDLCPEIMGDWGKAAAEKGY